jgi:hypothetical protein
MGSTTALTSLGVFYGKGIVVGKDAHTEIQCHFRAIEYEYEYVYNYNNNNNKINSVALFNLALSFPIKNSDGLNMDSFAVAARFFEHSVTLGNAMALGFKSKLLLDTDHFNTTAEYITVVEYMIQSALLGYTEAMRLQGKANHQYYHSKCKSQETLENSETATLDVIFNTALQWYKRAVRYSSVAALQDIATLYRDRYRFFRAGNDLNIAIDYYYEASHKSYDVKTLFALADVYKKDKHAYKKAIEIYRHILHQGGIQEERGERGEIKQKQQQKQQNQKQFLPLVVVDESSKVEAYLKLCKIYFSGKMMRLLDIQQSMRYLCYHQGVNITHRCIQYFNTKYQLNLQMSLQSVIYSTSDILERMEQSDYLSEYVIVRNTALFRNMIVLIHLHSNQLKWLSQYLEKYQIQSDAVYMLLSHVYYKEGDYKSAYYWIEQYNKWRYSMTTCFERGNLVETTTITTMTIQHQSSHMLPMSLHCSDYFERLTNKIVFRHLQDIFLRNTGTSWISDLPIFLMRDEIQHYIKHHCDKSESVSL